MNSTLTVFGNSSSPFWIEQKTVQASAPHYRDSLLPSLYPMAWPPSIQTLLQPTLDDPPSASWRSGRAERVPCGDETPNMAEVYLAKA